jgi:RNA 3'-terminal phosphate cyclase (ATP)
MAETVSIDGSHGEGGGQILRTSVSLAAITGRPVHIFNIRAGRSKPGLQPQHLTAVRAAAQLCEAELRGAAVGSLQLFFTPTRAVRGDHYLFNIGTAGATALVGQTVILPLALSGGSLSEGGVSSASVTGGTHVPHSPPAEYLELVYLPTLREAGLRAHLSYPSVGFYPRGGGELDLRVHPVRKLAPLEVVERGELRGLRAIVVTGRLDASVSARGAEVAAGVLGRLGPLRVEERQKPSAGSGAAMVLIAECDGALAGFTALGERGKPWEAVAAELEGEFKKWWASGAACDEHLGDQLVLPAALAEGESRWTTALVTEHLRTVLWLTEQFVPIEHRLEERENGSGFVSVRGAGVRR